MINRRPFLHYLSLAGALPALSVAIAIGTVLRFWHLDSKPLWMDEIITAIFSLGKNYRDLPLDVVFSLNQVQEIFTFQPGVSCAQIAENLANYSTHPPLFFCLMYRWLEWMSPLGIEWVAKLRSLPALFGVAAIIAIYGLNSVAFSPTSGVMAALLMALSPFAVYLSQEARHYTLPMLFIILSLFFLIQIQQDIFQRKKVRFWVWLLWVINNIIGLYVHYFFVLAFISQIATLLLLIYQGRSKIFNLPQICLSFILSTGGVIIGFIPWLLVIYSHFHKSETNWLPSPHHIEPIYQTLMHWVLMIITLPVENQPLLIAVICGFLMVMFTIWVGFQIFPNLKLLWSNSTTHLSTFTLLSFTFFVLLQFFLIAYLLGKDITVIPRYSFVYYPSFCSLLAASLVKMKNKKFIFLLVGIVSCIFVVSNLAFQKPFQPEQIAQNMNLDPAIPLMLVVGYENYQDVAAGLSFALALEQQRSHEVKSKLHLDNLAFVHKSPDFSDFSNKLAQLSIGEVSELNLWFVGSGMRKQDYPSKLTLAGQVTCNIELTQHYRIGQFPYQLYRCGNS
ncbi:glycosyltransferase family 39 protein [Anabaena lutea]|uniref:Glycosyltransferase family 39 protein n=1 Tax=Anabaena lutea FACHB-196 TaxID=2692881 RepID=A0ABR8FCS4_9NOST|nr:glycosyltransferase family 39 protein [Anabaena lutea]MBD2568033.1 glycosyltransferase family 39 protein [Anabaena lutea FACHB-196]